MTSARPIRPLLWVASSRRDYGLFPNRVQESFGFELFLAQTGQHPPSAKPLKGLSGGVVELIGRRLKDAETDYAERFRKEK